MAKSERSKCLKHSEGIDRITSLPKPLLSHILSLLPTKNAVATSLLSTRWRFLWTSITSVNFHFADEQASHTCSGEALDMKSKKFTQFVNRVLLLLNPPCIQNFQLICYHKYCDPFYLESWILAAIGRTFYKLDLLLLLAQPMELPLSHFCCKTLAVLILKGDIHFNVAASASICFPNLLTLHLSNVSLTIASNCSVSFPSLKNLLLNYVNYANEESVHKLFASCPVLDNLEINRSDWDNVVCLIISIPSLRSLTSSFECSDWISEGRAYKLHIDTPALKYLYLKDCSMCEYFTAEDTSSLLEARVMFHFDGLLTVDANSYSINIFEFIGGLFNVKFLSISGAILKVIRCITANIAPAFHNLTQLVLSGYSCRDWSVVIKNILESSYNLEHLVMIGNDCSGYHETWWTEPSCVPMCLLRRVTTISFSDMFYYGCSDELEMVRYFLKNAEALELLTIHTEGYSEENYKLMQKITMMPRGSRACQVAFK